MFYSRPNGKSLKIHPKHLYEHASLALKWVEETGGSLDDLPENFVLSNESYKLVKKTIWHEEEIKYLLKKTRIVEDQTDSSDIELIKFLAKILITETLWHNGYIKHIEPQKEIEILVMYEEQIQEAYRETLTVTKGICSLPVYVKINTLVMKVEDAIILFCKEGWHYIPSAQSYDQYLRNIETLEGNNFMKDFHISELLVFPSDSSFYQHPGYLTGKFILQDKGSCLSSFLLNPQPGSIVLDVGAATGLKTNHLANMMQGKGLIIANDNHPKRIEMLQEMIDVTQMNCVKIHEGFFEYTRFDECSEIQYILVDATSSNSGIFFDTNGIEEWIDKVRLSQHQFTLSKLLRTALQKFPNVKRVVYSICSMYPEEGEEVVDDALKTVGNSFVLLNTRKMLWNEWSSLSSPRYLCGEQCIRTAPRYDHCLGYFIAVFQRNPDFPVPEYDIRRYNPLPEPNTKIIKHQKKVPNPVKPIKQKKVPHSKISVLQKRGLNTSIEVNEERYRLEKELGLSRPKVRAMLFREKIRRSRLQKNIRKAAKREQKRLENELSTLEPQPSMSQESQDTSDTSVTSVPIS